MSDEQVTITRNYSRRFEERDDAMMNAWIGKLEDHNLLQQFAPIYISMKPAYGGSFSATLRLGPDELRAFAKELIGAADFLETHNPNKP